MGSTSKQGQTSAEKSAGFGPIAERFRRAGDLERAVTLCREGLEKFPEHLSGRVTLGWALLDLGRYDEARTALEQVLKRAPDNLAAIRGLAELHDRAESTMYLDMAGPGAWPPEETEELAASIEAGPAPTVVDTAPASSTSAAEGLALDPPAAVVAAEVPLHVSFESEGTPPELITTAAAMLDLRSPAELARPPDLNDLDTSIEIVTTTQAVTGLGVSSAAGGHEAALFESALEVNVDVANANPVQEAAVPAALSSDPEPAALPSDPEPAEVFEDPEIALAIAALSDGPADAALVTEARAGEADLSEAEVHLAELLAERANIGAAAFESAHATAEQSAHEAAAYDTELGASPEAELVVAEEPTGPEPMPGVVDFDLVPADAELAMASASSLAAQLEQARALDEVSGAHLAPDAEESWAGRPAVESLVSDEQLSHGPVEFHAPDVTEEGVEGVQPESDGIAASPYEHAAVEAADAFHVPEVSRMSDAELAHAQADHALGEAVELHEPAFPEASGIRPAHPVFEQPESEPPSLITAAVESTDAWLVNELVPSQPSEVRDALEAGHSVEADHTAEAFEPPDTGAAVEAQESHPAPLIEAFEAVETLLPVDTQEVEEPVPADLELVALSMPEMSGELFNLPQVDLQPVVGSEDEPLDLLVALPPPAESTPSDEYSYVPLEPVTLEAAAVDPMPDAVSSYSFEVIAPEAPSAATVPSPVYDVARRVETDPPVRDNKTSSSKRSRGRPKKPNPVPALEMLLRRVEARRSEVSSDSVV